MQTFLPYPDFAKTASVLDYRRLGKQRLECKQIYMALTNPTYGWQNHPAVKQWKGYESALVRYAIAICKNWRSRGYKDVQLDYFVALPHRSTKLPPWMGNEAFHASHREALLFKNLNWYSQWGWSEKPKKEYVWPSQQITK
jgi:hypothetical protein